MMNGKSRFTKIIVAMMIFSLVIPTMLNTNKAMATDCKLCTGTASGWVTNEGTEGECGLCGIETTYTRTVKTCTSTNDENDSCTSISLITKKKDKQTLNKVSALEEDGCEAAYALKVGELDIVLQACLLVWAIDCAGGCLYFGPPPNPAYLACAAACATAAGSACAIAYAITKQKYLCEKTECIFSCTIDTFFTVTTETNACT